jgi:hypothetical protein
MLFIESPVADDELALVKLLHDSHDPVHGVPAPVVCLGRAIIWKHRRFRELCLADKLHRMQQEDAIYGNWRLPRTRLLVGSYRGEVFTTPPDERRELAARVREGGRCALAACLA